MRYKYSKNNIIKHFFNILPVKRAPIFLTFHNIEEKDLNWFRLFINLYQDRIKSIRYFHSENINDSDIFLSFDDGFYSNYEVARNVLDQYDIKALFFVTYRFINLNIKESHDFANKNMYPQRNISFSKEYKSMSWDNLKYLSDDGHEIGAHTMSHPNLRNLDSEAQYYEIRKVKDLLEYKLNINIQSFAYPFGSPSNIDHNSFKLVKAHYKYGFVNIRGSISKSISDHLILRQNIVPGMPLWLIDAIVNSKLDFFYRKHRKQLKKNMK